MTDFWQNNTASIKSFDYPASVQTVSKQEELCLFEDDVFSHFHPIAAFMISSREPAGLSTLLHGSSPLLVRWVKRDG
jgi:hypothetical protein